MPNQRSKNNTTITISIERDLLKRFDEIIKRKNDRRKVDTAETDRTKLVTDMVNRYCDKEEARASKPD